MTSFLNPLGVFLIIHCVFMSPTSIIATEEDMNGTEHNITVRLEIYGLLLVRKGAGEYGTVCDDSFDVNDAKVVCRMLGLPTDNARVLIHVGGGAGRSIFMDDIHCRGDESSLNECEYNGWGRHDCGHYEDVGVRCEGGTTEAKIQVHLESNGLLLVRTNGDYGTVCNDRFDIEDASVVCGMLGLSTDNIQVLTRVSGGSGKNIFMDEVNCTGDETSLNECDFRGWGIHNCDHSEDVGVICGGPIYPSRITARLESNGLLLVKRNESYGTVCDDNFDVRDARVVCRMLGLSTDNVQVLTGVSGGENRSIFMDEVQCSGDENSLNECSYRGWGRHNCVHNEDVGVRCGITAHLENNGLLLVKTNGDYGTVCGHQFDVNDARVVCRMLGLPTGYVRVLYHVSGVGSGRNTFLDEIQCKGHENSLNECVHNGWGRHDCSRDYSEDVGVRCERTIRVRLESNGLLLVRTNGDYGTVCDDSFGLNDARVVCRMLGRSTNKVLVLTGVSGGSRRNILMDNVQCRGYESSLNECNYNEWGRHNCGHFEDVGVKCEYPPNSTCQSYKDKAYFFMNIPVNYYDAKKYCEKWGMYVVTVKDAAMNTWLYNTKRRLFFDYRTWIGLTDMKQEGHFEWHSGYPYYRSVFILNRVYWVPIYQNWLSGEPNDDKHNEDCVEYGRFAHLNEWNDIPCTEGKKFICESSLTSC